MTKVWIKQKYDLTVFELSRSDLYMYLAKSLTLTPGSSLSHKIHIWTIKH